MKVEKRVERLERENRRHRWGLVLLLVLLAASFLVKRTPSALGREDITAKTIVAETIQVGERPGGISITTGDRGAEIKISDSQGNPLLVIGRDERGHGALATFDGSGVKLISLTGTTQGCGAITTFNGTGEKLVSVLPNSVGRGAVVTYDGEGIQLVSMGTTETGEGAIAAFDRAGKVRSVWP